MMSGQKKKKINKAEVIGKGLLTVLLIALELAIWPGYLVYNNYMSSSYSEYSVYSEPITERTEITQYFKPLYSSEIPSGHAVFIPAQYICSISSAAPLWLL